MKLHVYYKGERSPEKVFGLFVDSFFHQVFVVSDFILLYKCVLSNAIW